MRIFLSLLAKRVYRQSQKYTPNRHVESLHAHFKAKNEYILNNRDRYDEEENFHDHENRNQFSRSRPSQGFNDWKRLSDVRSRHDDYERHAPKEKPELVPLDFDVTPENRFEIMNDIMCQLHKEKYENQLKIKHMNMKSVMKQMAQRVMGASPVVVDSYGMPCPMEHVVPSPRIEGYRNKDEFTIWPGIDGNKKTVGFFVGEPGKHSNCLVVEPDHLLITKDSHKRIASLFQTYLREVSPLDTCMKFDQGGNWRRFVVRSTESGDHMIIGQMHPQDLTPEEIQDEKDRMTKFFEPYVEELQIKSAYLQCLKQVRASHEEYPFELLFGTETLTETLLGKLFQVSPESFFQINTLAAEKLYETVIREVSPDTNTTVIDLCSGTGTMSILLAPYVRRVIGIEQSTQAVNDAQKNASLNKVRNVTFLNGKIEDLMPKLSDEFFNQRVVVIANPSRNGLRSSVVSTIRDMRMIDKLVYVSCKPAGDALRNFCHLAFRESNKRFGAPMVPVNATPVDLFPQTPHCELVVTFERFLSG